MRESRFEVVHSDAGWFARFIASNGSKVWQTEVYGRRRHAGRAIELITGQPVVAWRDTWEVPFQASEYGLLEVREVDERTVPEDVSAGDQP